MHDFNKHKPTFAVSAAKEGWIVGDANMVVVKMLNDAMVVLHQAAEGDLALLFGELVIDKSKDRID